jgi:hypothetical protein
MSRGQVKAEHLRPAAGERRVSASQGVAPKGYPCRRWYLEAKSQSRSTGLSLFDRFNHRYSHSCAGTAPALQSATSAFDGQRSLDAPHLRGTSPGRRGPRTGRPNNRTSIAEHPRPSHPPQECPPLILALASARDGYGGAGKTSRPSLRVWSSTTMSRQTSALCPRTCSPSCSLICETVCLPILSLLSCLRLAQC